MQNQISTLIENIPLKTLQQAASAVSLRYRMGEKPYLRSKEDYLAYLVVRLPATLAAIEQVFKQIPSVTINSFLDLGAGPGTAFFALEKYFPPMTTMTFLENDPQFIELGKQLVNDAVIWQQAMLPCELAAHDLVLMSYSLNEMVDIDKVIHTAWNATNKLLVLIEPGTPKGYQRLMHARDLLLTQNASIVAPCPHALPCPLKGDDWCHFSAHVARSKMHRLLKQADLGFEDEKFSYLIVSREDLRDCQARIIKQPEIHKGWMKIAVCTEGTIEEQTIREKDKESYRKSRKLNWGDCIP